MPLIIDGVEIPIEAVTDNSSFQSAKKQIDDLIARQDRQNKKLDEKYAAIEKVKKSEAAAAAAAKKQQDAYLSGINRQREQMEKLQQVTMLGGMAGAAILTPMILAAKKFVDNAAEGDRVAQQWVTSMAGLDNASNRAGRVIANELNPVIATTAKIVNQLVGVLESNPGIASAALVVGGGLVSLAGMASMLIAINKTVLTMQAMTAAGGLAGPGTAGAAALPLVTAAGAIAAGVVASGVAVILVNDLINKTALGGEIESAQARIRASGKAYQGVVRPDEAAANISGTATPGAITPGPRRRDFTDIAKTSENKAAVLNYKKQFDADIAAAQKDVAEAQKKMADAEKESQKKRLAITQEYADAQVKIAQELQAATAAALAKLKKDQAQAQQDTADEIEKIQRDSGKRLEQIEKTHAQNQYELLASRDALGLVKEQARYNDEKKQEQDKASEEIADRRAALRRKLSDLRQSYNEELLAARRTASEKLKLAAQERDAQLKLLAEQQRATYDIMVSAFQAALQKLQALGGGSYAPSGGTSGNATAPASQAGTGFAETAALSRNAARASSGAGAGAGMTVNVNLGGGTLTQFRQIVNATKAEVAREFIGALEAV